MPLTRSPFHVARTCHTGASALLAALAITLAAAASASSPSRLEAGVLAGGGGHSAGARFALEGTAGQPATAMLSGARFGIAGGFWQGAPVGLADVIFRNGFED
jgi:hypothetical protein